MYIILFLLCGIYANAYLNTYKIYTYIQKWRIDGVARYVLPTNQMWDLKFIFLLF